LLMNPRVLLARRPSPAASFLRQAPAICLEFLGFALRPEAEIQAGVTDRLKTATLATYKAQTDERWLIRMVEQ